MAQTTLSQSATDITASYSTRSYLRDGLLILSAALMVVTLYMVFMWVPTEQNLGVSQRIFYFHVPLGWIGMLSIMVVAVASFLHLITGKQKWDSLAYATAELGVIFASLILVTGSIWAKPVWGVWWTWDAKLTTTLILWFIYVGYLMIRAYGPSGSQGKRYASVIALIGAIDAPIIYKATDWWRTTHPERNVPSDLDDRMLLTLLVGMVTFTVLYIYLLIERYNLRKSESDLDELHQRTA
ncbi:MAG: cytochrome c biogenesis protein CcsA [Chloroflexi bacterium]|nr:cytochrome c biogenesis protein CcsA [Chloroflexota bacterium]